MLNRGARRCIKGILEAAPEVAMSDCVILRKPLEPQFCETTRDLAKLWCERYYADENEPYRQAIRAKLLAAEQMAKALEYQKLQFRKIGMSAEWLDNAITAYREASK